MRVARYMHYPLHVPPFDRHSVLLRNADLFRIGTASQSGAAEVLITSGSRSACPKPIDGNASGALGPEPVGVYIQS